MARNSLLCADVPLRNYSLTHLLITTVRCAFESCKYASRLDTVTVQQQQYRPGCGRLERYTVELVDSTRPVVLGVPREASAPASTKLTPSTAVAEVAAATDA